MLKPGVSKLGVPALASVALLSVAGIASAGPIPLKCTVDNGGIYRIVVDADALKATIQSSVPGDDKLVFTNGATVPVPTNPKYAQADYVKVDESQMDFGRYSCSVAKTLMNLPCADDILMRVAINRYDGTMLLSQKDQKDAHGNCAKDDSQQKF